MTTVDLQGASGKNGKFAIFIVPQGEGSLYTTIAWLKAVIEGLWEKK